MTVLRQRMIEDMQVRNLSPHTQASYHQQVSLFARHFGKSPDALTPEHIRTYQIYLTNEKKLAAGSIHIAVAALRFLYKITLKREWTFADVLPLPKKPQKLPVVLSPEEVVHFLGCVACRKQRVILTACYAAGLRVSEAVRLNTGAIDGKRMVIRVDQGKGRKDSPAPTSGPFSSYSERRHTAHEQQAEARITYRFHPRSGETVGVRRRLKRGGTTFVVVHQLDGSFACLPAWMTDEAASRFEIGDEPRFPLDILRSLRNEVDALLGLLASESKTERPENDAPIRESPAKPFRGRATVRRTAGSSKERARDGHRGAAARDRGGSGKGGKRGDRR
jgi:site-specific recombinase XerC